MGEKIGGSWRDRWTDDPIFAGENTVLHRIVNKNCLKGTSPETSSHVVLPRCHATQCENILLKHDGIKVEDNAWALVRVGLQNWTFPKSRGYPNSWMVYLCHENPCINGWFGGTPILGNLMKPSETFIFTCWVYARYIELVYGGCKVTKFELGDTTL